jgi:serine protease AprX
MTHDAALPHARGRSRGFIIALAVALMLPSLMPLSRTVGHWLGAQISVIVRGFGPDDAQVRRAVGDVGGHVVRSIKIIDGVVATVPADAVPALRSEPGVVEVSPNAKVHLQGMLSSANWNQAGDVGSLYNTTLMTGAQAYWSAGYTGRGIDVAVIDSGVVPVNGLHASGKIVFGPDLSFDSQAPNLTNLDGFGHGTHLSGIIAGRDDSAVAGQYAGDTKDFLGMAPDSRIVSIKVADSLGNTDVSQVLAAIDWVVQHHADPGLNIRVVNMSFGTDSYQNYVYDPLTYAAEMAWHAGVVVVAATGNSGLKTGVMDPADDPYLVAVGAADTNGTVGTADDTVASFSAGGDGYRNPDLVAPGAHIVSLRDPGSYIDDNYPTARVAGRYFRGSGTSQAAAVVSGAAALLLSQNPLLTPDQVKNLLTSTATPLANAAAIVQGAGELDLRGALTAVPAAAVQAFAPGTGTGSLEGARGSAHLSWNGVTLQGETDIFGSPVNTGALAQALASGGAWNGGTFNGVIWTGQGWGTLLTSDGFSAMAWNNATWTATSWSANQWSANQWSANQWSANQWSANQWSANQWSANQWSANQWSSAGWS